MALASREAGLAHGLVRLSISVGLQSEHWRVLSFFREVLSRVRLQDCLAQTHGCPLQAEAWK